MMPCGLKEEFDITSGECAFCRHNLQCIEKSSKITCDITSGVKCLRGTSQFINCEFLHCDRVIELFRKKIAYEWLKCPNFGNPKISSIKQCLKCPQQHFEKCEIMSLLLQNQKEIDWDEAKDAISNQLAELNNEEDGCYGKFNNEAVCSDCEFLINCMRKTGISMGESCVFFPKPNEEMSLQCKECIFNDECVECFLLREEKIEIMQKKKILNQFCSVADLRNNLYIDEDDD